MEKYKKYLNHSNFEISNYNKLEKKINER